MPMEGFQVHVGALQIAIAHPEAVLTCEHGVMGAHSVSDLALIAAGVSFKCHGPGMLH